MILVLVDRHGGTVLGERGKAEALGGRGHLQGLMGPLGVVAVHPGIELGLGLLEGGE